VLRVKILCAILFLSWTSYPGQSAAQVPDSILKALEYYPLEVGNQWQYSFNTTNGSSEGTGAYPFTEVLSTTLGINGKWYQKVQEGYRAPYRVHYERVDTSTAIVYRFAPGTVINGQTESEYPIFLLPTGAARRTWKRDSSSFRELNCRWGNDREFMGELVPIWICSDDDGRNNWDWELAEGVGMVYQFMWTDQPFSFRLRYSRVRGQETGIAVGTERPMSPPRSELVAYPNPIRPGDQLVVEGIMDQKAMSIQLVDAMGRRVHVEEFAAGHSQLTMDLPAHLAPGVYVLNIMQQNQRTSRLITLKR